MITGRSPRMRTPHRKPLTLLLSPIESQRCFVALPEWLHREISPNIHPGIGILPLADHTLRANPHLQIEGDTINYQ